MSQHPPQADAMSKLSLMRCLSARDTLMRNLLGARYGNIDLNTREDLGKETVWLQEDMQVFPS